MARKPPPSRAAAAPVPVALERLARLAAAGTPPDRLVREAQKIIAEWKADPDLDAGALRERLETLRDDLAAGVADAAEQAGDVDQSDKAAARQATSTLRGLQAVHDAVVAEMLG